MVAAVDGEELVVRSGPRIWLSGRASCSRMTSASRPREDEEDEGGDDVTAADLLVVDGGNQPQMPGGRPRCSQVALGCARGSVRRSLFRVIRAAVTASSLQRFQPIEQACRSSGGKLVLAAFWCRA